MDYSNSDLIDCYYLVVRDFTSLLINRAVTLMTGLPLLCVCFDYKGSMTHSPVSYCLKFYCDSICHQDKFNYP